MTFDPYANGPKNRSIARGSTRSFDPLDHHEYGLIRVSEREYVRCTGDCCKLSNGEPGGD